MKNSGKIAIIILLLFVLFSCDDFNSPKGDLHITVYNEINNPVIGADVYIYDNETDMINEENLYYEWKITDTTGTVKFKDVKAQTYWFYSKINQVKLSDSAVVVMDSTTLFILNL